MVSDKKSRIPTISPDRLDKTPAKVPNVTSYDDRRAKAFIKGKELTVITSLRIPESHWAKLKTLSFCSNKSLNKHILEAINYYLSQPEIKGKITRAKKNKGIE